MNDDELKELLHEIKKVNYLLGKIVEKRISILLNKYLKEAKNFDQSQIKALIRERVLNAFLLLIDDESKQELCEANLSISEISHRIEAKNPTWHIFEDSAKKYANIDGKWVVKDCIPREYRNGFVLTEENKKSEEAVKFIEDNAAYLQVLSGFMDRRDEIFTGDYKTKDNVPRELTEKLIDYLGYKRNNNELDDEANKNNKKNR